MDGVLLFGDPILGGAGDDKGVVPLLLNGHLACTANAVCFAVIGGSGQLHGLRLKGDVHDVIRDRAAERGTEADALHGQLRQRGVGGRLVVGILLPGGLDHIAFRFAVGRRDLQRHGVDAHRQLRTADGDALPLVGAVIIQTQLGHAVRDLGGVVRRIGGKGRGQGEVAAHDGGQGAVVAGCSAHASRPAGGAELQILLAVRRHNVFEFSGQRRTGLGARCHLQRHGDDPAAGAVGAVHAEAVLVDQNAPAADRAAVIGEGQALAAVEIRRQAVDLAVHRQRQRHGVTRLHAAAAGEGRTCGIGRPGQRRHRDQQRRCHGQNGTEQFLFHELPPTQMVRWPTVTCAACTTSVMVMRPSPLMSPAIMAASSKSPALAA